MLENVGIGSRKFRTECNRSIRPCDHECDKARRLWGLQNHGRDSSILGSPTEQRIGNNLGLRNRQVPRLTGVANSLNPGTATKFPENG